jgi:hypothetical protein
MQSDIDKQIKAKKKEIAKNKDELKRLETRKQTEDISVVPRLSKLYQN